MIGYGHHNVIFLSVTDRQTTVPCQKSIITYCVQYDRLKGRSKLILGLLPHDTGTCVYHMSKVNLPSVWNFTYKHVFVNIQRVIWLQSAARGRPAFGNRAISTAVTVRRLLRTQVLLPRLPWWRWRETDRRQRWTLGMLSSMLRELVYVGYRLISHQHSSLLPPVTPSLITQHNLRKQLCLRRKDV